jgi:hypothetical protein
VDIVERNGGDRFSGGLDRVRDFVGGLTVGADDDRRGDTGLRPADELRGWARRSSPN